MDIIDDSASVGPLSSSLHPYMCQILHIYMGVIGDSASLHLGMPAVHLSSVALDNYCFLSDGGMTCQNQKILLLQLHHQSDCEFGDVNDSLPWARFLHDRFQIGIQTRLPTMRPLCTVCTVTVSSLDIQIRTQVHKQHYQKMSSSLPSECIYHFISFRPQNTLDDSGATSFVLYVSKALGHLEE